MHFLKQHTLRLFTLMLSSPLLAQINFSELDVSSGEEDLLFADIPSVFSASKYEQKVTEAPARDQYRDGR